MIVRSNAIGIPLIAWCRGPIAMRVYLVCGVPSALFWGVVTCFATILPSSHGARLGSARGLSRGGGKLGRRVGLMAYGVLRRYAVGTMRPVSFYRRRMADTHPLVTILGVLIGLARFGFMGDYLRPACCWRCSSSLRPYLQRPIPRRRGDRASEFVSRDRELAPPNGSGADIRLPIRLLNASESFIRGCSAPSRRRRGHLRGGRWW